MGISGAGGAAERNASPPPVPVIEASFDPPAATAPAAVVHKPASPGGATENEIPVSGAPVSKAPVAEVPVSEIPASAAPVSEDPAPEVPVSEIPLPLPEVPVSGDPAPLSEIPLSEIPSLAPPAASSAAIDRVSARVLTLDLTNNPNDIWDRIRRGFGMPDISSDRVVEQQFFYLNRPAYLDRTLNRGARYLYYIVGELERRGLPTELALLPMVESSYNPVAYSRAHASGLWQFIPSTGRNYNLTQNRWIDERRDVIASTNAALDYLENIYEMHGDWQLALASYNWGENAVARALERNRDAGLPTEYSALNMPTETRNYLPKLQAIKNIIARPELFHIELPYIANEQILSTVAAPIGIDLATAARYAELPLEEFLAFNPGYNRPAITTSGQTLVVPSDRAPRFAARLDEFSRSGKGWRSHTLARGEKINDIASRHGLTVGQLLQINGLHARSRLSPGYSLLVPGQGANLGDALAVAQLLPDSARAAARAGVRIEPERGARKGRNKTSARGKDKTPRGKKTAAKGKGKTGKGKTVAKGKANSKTKTAMLSKTKTKPTSQAKAKAKSAPQTKAKSVPARGNARRR
jgi:membrane-bound lytic murein transglycosylase D